MKVSAVSWELAQGLGERTGELSGNSKATSRPRPVSIPGLLIRQKLRHGQVILRRWCSSKENNIPYIGCAWVGRGV